uniref:Uncharacterized protein n=1 Tax=Anguilla anguilla TaxID=7936 RepID=A0A0E9RTP0_ANGAN
MLYKTKYIVKNLIIILIISGIVGTCSV